MDSRAGKLVDLLVLSSLNTNGGVIEAGPRNHFHDGKVTDEATPSLPERGLVYFAARIM